MYDLVFKLVPGSNSMPILICVAPSRNGRGLSFILKIEELFYAMQMTNINRKSINLRCRFYAKNSGGCKFTSTLHLMHVFEKNHPHFFRIENLRVKPKSTVCHTCTGYGSEIEAKKFNEHRHFFDLLQIRN